MTEMNGFDHSSGSKYYHSVLKLRLRHETLPSRVRMTVERVWDL